MEKANFGRLVSFIFGIANDCLVDVYDVGDYRKIILPMTPRELRIRTKHSVMWPKRHFATAPLIHFLI